MTPLAEPRQSRIPILLRPNQPTDESFIIHSWLHSFEDAPGMRWAPLGTFYRIHHPKAEALLREHGALIACHPRDTDQILGWIVRDRGDANVIHYVYVKQPCRRQGIAAALISHRPPKEGPLLCTYWTEPCESISQKHLLIHATSLLKWPRRVKGPSSSPFAKSDAAEPM